MPAEPKSLQLCCARMIPCRFNSLGCRHETALARGI